MTFVNLVSYPQPGNLGELCIAGTSNSLCMVCVEI